MTPPLRIGIVGCGDIARKAYMKFLPTFDNVQMVACADMDVAKAQQFATDFSLEAMSVECLLSADNVDLVLNLTIPAAHASVNIQAMQQGKHVYVEKPLAVTLDDGREQLKVAKQTNLRVGCAPDTFLGGGLQTCRKLIDDGAIGRPVAATAFMQCHGHESWHPSPEFYYKKGGGPMLDMGPYYLTALVHLIGPVRRVAGCTAASFPTRTITSKPLNGKVIDVEVTTHVAGTMEFTSGAIATVVTSFDVWAHHMPCIEIHGTEGSLSVPDPNTFGGKVSIWRTGKREWTDVPLTHTDQTGRGFGVADMAAGIANNRPHRASGELALHVLETMHAFDQSSQTGRHVSITSPCRQPDALPTGLPPGHVPD